VLRQEVMEAPARVASRLYLRPPGRVFTVERVRLVGPSPLILLWNNLVYARCRGIEQVDFRREGLFATLEERYGLHLDQARRLFQSQRAVREVAEYLRISPGAPVMYLEQSVHLADGSPIELSDIWL
jgi:GntR family transcriptional regulator